jgi:hypothetical protein
MDSLKKQIGGDHYHNRTIQPIEYILANDMNFCEGCVIKYVTRWREKGGVEDLHKAMHYLQFLIEDQERTPEDVMIETALEAVAHNPNVGSVSNLAAKIDEAWEAWENFPDDPGDSQPKTTAISDPYPTDYKKYPEGY